MVPRILRPLSYGDLLDEMFDLYKKNFLVLAGISAVVFVPLNAIMFGLFSDVFSGAAVRTPDPMVLAKAGLSILFFSIVIAFPLQSFAQAATTWAVSRNYLGEPATIAESYKAVGRTVIMFTLTMLLSGLIIFIGMMLCFVPGIIFALWYSLVAQVYVIEGKSGMEALNRSKDLFSGNGLRVFLVLLIAWILVQILQKILIFPFELSMQSNPMGTFSSPYGVVFGIATGVVSAVTYPIMTIATTLLYYDLRVRKEGFDIQMLAANMGQGIPPTPGGYTPGSGSNDGTVHNDDNPQQWNP